MEDKTIELVYRRADFEEFYYRNGNGKTFFNSKFRQDRIIFVVFCSGFLLTLICIPYTGVDFGFLTLTGVASCIAFYSWYIKASYIIKWKKVVKEYLDTLDKISANKLILTNKTFSLIQDRKETIEKWTEFNKAKIEDDFISLTSNTSSYLIPKKSINHDDFQFLKIMITEKIKND